MAINQSLSHAAGVLATALASVAMPATAQQPLPKIGDRVTLDSKVAPALNEFRKTQAGLGCSLAQPAPTYAACVRLGALRPGLPLESLQTTLIAMKTVPEAVVRAPRHVGTTPDGGTNLLIPLATADAGGGKTGMVSYLVVQVDKAGLIEALQLTGHPGAPTQALPFSGLRLGSAQQQVIDTLGLPSSVQDVPQIQGKQWNYAPFPFSIEFGGGVVYSIRVARPRGGGPFVPLARLPN